MPYRHRVKGYVGVLEVWLPMDGSGTLGQEGSTLEYIRSRGTHDSALPVDQLGRELRVYKLQQYLKAP